jgi:hypothetical protein
MPRWADAHDDWDDDLDSDQDEETADEDDEPTIPCPHCRQAIHEDSQRCPYCERYISTEDSPPSRKPWWFVLGVVACFYVIYRWVVWL